MYLSRNCRHWNTGVTRAVHSLLAGGLIVLGVAGLGREASAQFYQQVNLVSDLAGVAEVTDTNLVGAWGVTHSPTSPWWVNTTFSGLSLVFNGAGQPLPVVVTIPPAMATATGITFNGTKGFLVGSNAPAIFIFVTLNGTISGWNPGQSKSMAILKVDNQGTAQYSGVALAEADGQDLLFVANFGQNRIDVFDSSFNPVTLPSGAFIDDNVPANLKVFNIMHIDDSLVVTYAPTNVFSGPNEAGQGFVSIFDVHGMLIEELEWGPWMNAPWGVAWAPGGFGKFSRRLLVGMFGNGQIAAFDTKHGHFHGLLKGADREPIAMGKGLWGLGFGNGANAGPTDTLFFAADFLSGGNFHGLFGALTRLTGPKQKDDANEAE